MSTNLTGFEPVVPSNKEVALARKSGKLLSNYAKSTKKSVLQLTNNKKENTNIELPQIALNLLINILGQLSQGNAISLIPIHSELTTQEAADLLNVSRPYLINLLEEGKIPFHKIGTKRRILAKDVIHYKMAIHKKRYKILEKMSAIGQEMKIGY